MSLTKFICRSPADLPSGDPDCHAPPGQCQHQLCVEPPHYATLRHPVPSPSARHGDNCLPLAFWTGPVPEVVVRASTVYEALGGQEVDHD